VSLVGLLLAIAPSVAGQQTKAAHNTGVSLITPDQYAAIPLLEAEETSALPAGLSLRSFLPEVPITGQGSQPSCVGWALAGLKAYQEQRQSPQNKPRPFSPSYIYNRTRAEVASCDAVPIHVGLNALARFGAVPLERFPYDESDCLRQPDESVAAVGRAYAIAGYRRVNGVDATEVKRHIANGRPVVVALAVDESFFALASPGVYDGPPQPEFDGPIHAMLVVGFNDQRGAFELLNSFGRTWGDRGYAWIPYDSFVRLVREAYVGFDIIANPSTMSFEVEQRVWRTEQRRETKPTGKHHCEANCRGEPTRTNYQIRIRTERPEGVLSGPRLACLSGPCYGYNQVLFERIEDDGAVAVGSWDVWGTPTVWELTVREQWPETAVRVVQTVALGEEFELTHSRDEPPPRVTATDPEGRQVQFEGGRATGSTWIRYVGTRTEAQSVVDCYRFLQQRAQPALAH
jgi:hypothetical protein